MGQLAFAAAGAVVSTYVGAGPQIGWAIGSVIGGIVFAPDGAQTTGPRLDDLKSNVSTYGQPIPRCYGQIGFMGSLIWMDDLRETENVQEEGKGGDPATATTFSYSCSFAMIICRGEVSTIPNSVPVAALNRIWINEKCYYDVRDETNIEAMVASSNFARFFTFYPGNQTQMPDPTMEAILGVGNVPAYRGRSYIVFKDLALAPFQNQPPGALRMVFEVTMTGTPPSGLRILKTVGPGAPASAGTYYQIMPITQGVVRILEAPGTGVFVNTVDGVSLGIDSRSEDEDYWPTGGIIADSIPVYGLIDRTAVRVAQGHYTMTIDDPGQILIAETFDGGTLDALPLLLPQTDYLLSLIPSADQVHIFVFTGVLSSTIDKWHLLKWNVADQEWELESTGTVGGSNVLTTTGGASSQGVFAAGMAESNNRWIWQINSAGTRGFSVHYLDDAGEIDLAYPYLNQALIDNFGAVYMYANNGTCYCFGGQYYFVLTRLDGAAVNNQTLQDVFEAETALAGLESSQVNGSFGSAIPVDGMFIRRLGPTRGVLGILEPAYFWDTVESAGVLKGVLRGGASAVTIEDEDLGAAEGTAEADLIKPERADEDSLPGEVIVTYIDRASDYQVAAQHDRRSAVETDQPVNLEMPLVFTPDEARQIGAVWMYNQWAGRTRRTIRLSRKYSYLEPTDVITLRTDIADFVVRIVAVKTNDGFLEMECVDEDAALYSQNSEGAPVEQGSEITLVTPTRLALLDIPMLRESDNNAGFYVAAAGYGDTWPGALILRSTDGGVSYSTVGSITTAATMGIVSLALDDFTGPMGYDAVNSVTVSLFGTQSLQSCTDAELLAGANAFALGNATIGYELLQFKTATLVTGKTWTLTQLLRGRRGTERLMGTHTTSETFVLLQASTLRRIAIDDPATGIENHYKAVTFGQLASLAPAVSFTNTSAGLKPYSPVNAAATGIGGDITITWDRRGRIHNAWNDGVELPLGEAVESYSIDIYDGVTLKRTLTSSTPSVVYSSANQTTDFGAPVSSGDADAYIYQLSAIVGRGFPLIFNIT